MWDEVRRINERGTTVFLTTQYLEEADQLCDRLAIIDDGRIVREGTPAQLKAELRERLGLAHEAITRRRVPRRDRRTHAPGRRGAGGEGMTYALVLGRRALREGIRTPEAIVPTLFIPLFFLVVNVGQAARIFPGSTTAFLHGQGYGAFQLPSLVAARGVVRQRRALPRRGDRGRLLRQAAGDARPRSAIVLGRL